ncbi:PKD domain-containing protein [Methylomagnum sp.]
MINLFYGGRHASFAALLAVATTIAAPPTLAASPKITAVAKFTNKVGKIQVTGKAKGIPAGSQVSIYDAAAHRLLFSGQTDAKFGFNFLIPQDAIPCQLQVEAGGAELAVAVAGAAKSCKTAPACGIVGGDRSATVGAPVALQIATKNKGVAFGWDFGDGATDQNKSSVSHAFNLAGLYQVMAVGTDASGAECADAITVSVAPPPGTNPNPPVSEPVARPAKAAAMPGTNGANDRDALVVFPFEDTGMEGGSQINIPYNALFPYNALNAQVIRKVPQKPSIVDSSVVSVYYSAASNPNDPAGANSINSTSQNYFQDGLTGANFDYTGTLGKASSTGETIYQDNHAYTRATIAKSEFWDKVHQPNASKLTTPVAEKGLSQADVQNAFTPAKPLVKPDEGLRGQVDKGAGVRAMPGIANPYKSNEPQPFAFSASQNSFVAQNIPLTSVDDQGRINPFPLLRVEAREGGAKKAATDAVYSTASDTGCRECHAKGKKGSEDIWRTPVRITELLNADGTPGPATGKGAFPLPPDYPATISLTSDPIADFKKYGYGPAVHAIFDGKFPLNPTQALVAPGIVLQYDANGLRTDRVAESRWLKPDGSTSPTNPGNDATWKLQIKLKFKEAKDYGEDNWVNQEKAARWNNMLVHDYMTPINYNNARDDVFTEVVDDQYTTRNSVTMCASHHTSTLKYDYGAAAVSLVTTLSQYTRTEHAFHGKMQVYKRDVTAQEAPDRQAHAKGDLIRDERGHPIMYGGRGWDSVHLDEEGQYYTKDANGNYTVKSAVPAFAPRNNWDPAQFPRHSLGEEMLPVGEKIPMEKNCLTCHTGKTEKAYRDVHHSAGLKCDSCHGDMLAVGLVYPHEMYDQNLTMGGQMGPDDPNTLSSVDFRRQWIDEPNCGSCHVGDANLDKNGEAGLNHYYSAGALKQGWKDGDSAAATIHPVNARFAVMPSKESRPEKVAATDAQVAAGLAAKKGDTIFVDREISQVLYRKSGDVHGSGPNGILNCSTCHGGSHGLWPNKDPNANDNVTARQLQGYDGNIAECSTCHIKDDFKTGLVATDGGTSGLGVGQGVRDGSVVGPASAKAFLAGPHGMHPVGDEYWYKHAEGAAINTSAGKHKDGLNGGWHNDMAKKPGPDGEDQCAACHGADHKGTRLSRSLVDRVLTNDQGKPVKVAKDQVIGCALCHSLAKSFTGAPNPKSPTGGWPAAKLHMPPMPQAVTASNSSGGSGGHH